MRNNPYPSCKETTERFRRKLTKSRKLVGRANLEQINSIIEDAIKQCKQGSPGKQSYQYL